MHGFSEHPTHINALQFVTVRHMDILWNSVFDNDRLETGIVYFVQGRCLYASSYKGRYIQTISYAVIFADNM